MTFLKYHAQIVLFVFLLIGFFTGCAAPPKKLMLTDIHHAYPQDTIFDSKMAKQVSFETLMEKLNTVKVIYIGERHVDTNHHAVQLNVIKSLHETNPDLCVGMEMFDRTYQEVLNHWVDGELDESEFLKRTHWYANWRYPFDLYRDILLFIKENNISLIGLNIAFHIPPKIAVGGLESLLDDDKKHLPQIINTEHELHRQYVEKVFEGHRSRGRDNFETFYEAQCVWEDTMAETIALSPCDGPMVVLAGNGHIIYKFGIPDRVFRLKPMPFITIFPAPAGSTAESGYADYIWVTPEIQNPHRMVIHHRP